MEVGLPLMALGHPVMAQPGLAFGVSTRPSDTSAAPGDARGPVLHSGIRAASHMVLALLPHQ